MDKRKARNLGGLVGCLAVTALVGCGLYYGNSGARSYIDGGSSSSAGQATSVTNSDGTLAIAAPGGVRFAHAVAGATLSLTATLSPSDATVRKLAWASGDSAKVSLASATTSSGASNIATLVATFSGFCEVTVSSVYDPSVKAVASLYCSNDQLSLSWGSVFSYTKENLGGSFSDEKASVGDFAFGAKPDYVCGAYDSSSTYPLWNGCSATGDLYYGFRFYGFGSLSSVYPDTVSDLGLSEGSKKKLDGVVDSSARRLSVGPFSVYWYGYGSSAVSGEFFACYGSASSVGGRKCAVYDLYCTDVTVFSKFFSDPSLSNYFQVFSASSSSTTPLAQCNCVSFVAPSSLSVPGGKF